MANEINQIGRIFAVMNCEGVAETDVERILAEKPRADSMKRSRPIERMCHWPGLRAEHLCRDALDPALHFGSGAARKGEQHYPTRVCTRDNQVRDAVGQCVGFARACARDDEKRRCFIKRGAAMFNSPALFRVALGELGCGHVPQGLADRMTRLGAVMSEAIVHHYGRDELLRRLPNPFWFQSFGAVMGMDWHSSGITTSVIGALKRGLGPLSGELGIHVCGGRGQHSRKTPDELQALGELIGFDGVALTRASRLE